MISYRNDREIPFERLTRRRAVDYCRVAAAL